MPTQFSKKKRCRQFRIRRHFKGEFDYSSFKAQIIKEMSNFRKKVQQIAYHSRSIPITLSSSSTTPLRISPFLLLCYWTECFMNQENYQKIFEMSKFTKFKTNPKGVEQTIPNQIELASKNGVTPREGNDIIRINPSGDTVTLIKK